jgi:hypothetical protein
MLTLDPVWTWILGIASQIILLIPIWRIAQKFGYPGWYAVALWVPVVNIVALYTVAFGETPLESAHGRLPQPDSRGG